MKTFRVVAAIAAVLSFAGVAHASSASTDATGGHYEWRLSPTYGPRAPRRAAARMGTRGREDCHVHSRRPL
jgi:hypothetical protein